jgi:antirestriction protein
MKICIEELGSRVWKWFDLPVFQSDIDKWIEDELNDIYKENEIGGIPEEFEVVDTDEITYLGSYTSIETYNEYFELLEEQDEVLVEYSVENLGYSISQIIKDPSVLEDLTKHESSIDEYVDTMIEEGLFGEIPDSLANYIDTDKLGRDLLLNGDVNEFTHNNKSYIIY